MTARKTASAFKSGVILRVAAMQEDLSNLIRFLEDWDEELNPGVSGEGDS